MRCCGSKIAGRNQTHPSALSIDFHRLQLYSSTCVFHPFICFLVVRFRQCQLKMCAPSSLFPHPLQSQRSPAHGKSLLRANPTVSLVNSTLSLETMHLHLQMHRRVWPQLSTGRSQLWKGRRFIGVLFWKGIVVPLLICMMIWREWTEFTPAARSDNPVRLRHWACITDSDPNASGEQSYVTIIQQL